MPLCRRRRLHRLLRRRCLSADAVATSVAERRAALHEHATQVCHGCAAALCPAGRTVSHSARDRIAASPRAASRLGALRLLNAYWSAASAFERVPVGRKCQCSMRPLCNAWLWMVAGLWGVSGTDRSPARDWLHPGGRPTRETARRRR